MTRTALLVRCDADEANRIRVEAQREHCSISRYVLRITLNAAAIESGVFSRLTDRSQGLLGRSTTRPSERTAILVRCDVAEAERIREAARRRDIRMNAFVLQALKSTWDQQMTLRVTAEAPLTAAHQ